jgi:hypothetical protein
MKKKINISRTLNLTKKYFFSEIIKKPMTTRGDLEFLADRFGIKPLKVEWLKDADPNYKGAQIINLGNPIIGGGSHWTCTYNGKYFDSFGLVPVQKFEDAGYEWIPLQKQNQNYGHCGTYCILWLYYAKIDELDKFYNLFETLN